MDEADTRKSEIGLYYQQSEVFETETEFIVHLVLPKIDAESIAIMLDERGIHVQAEQEHMAAEGVENGIYREDRLLAGYARYVPMPVCADLAKAEAAYAGDVLSIHVPKKADKKRKKLVAKKKRS